LNDISVISGL